MTAETVETPARTHAVRPLVWSLRRELWENPALWMAPLAVAALVFAGFFFAATGLGEDVSRAARGDLRLAGTFPFPFAAAAGAMFLISAVVGVFYCLGALHGERRDRSLLFWKSMPVSDVQVVASKLAVPVLVQPAIILLLTAAAHLLMLGWGLAMLAMSGVEAGPWLGQLHLDAMWRALPYGLLAGTLWDLPLFAWLFLVSAWARRMTFVWAVAPWLGLALFEFITFRTQHVWRLIQSRLFGGFDHAFAKPAGGPAARLPDLDPVGFLSQPGLWGGLVFAAVALAACVWLRRRAEPI